MLTIRNLYVRYKRETPLLEDLCLSMEEGATHGLVGLNGSGKTTLLNTLYMFIKPLAGEVHWQDSALSRRDIAYLEVDNFFYPYMTGREYLNLFNSSAGYFPIHEWEQLLSLPLDEITESYSTGMKKRLALLAVIKQDKPLILLDEPFNGLDMEGVHLLKMILERLHERGKTILITSHIYETLTDCCHYLHYLADCKIAKSYGQAAFPQLKEELRLLMEQRVAGQLDGLL